MAVAWPYANGPRHIGHVAGFGVPSDIFARYHRLKGNDVLMVSGTDEHGTPIMVDRRPGRRDAARARRPEQRDHPRRPPPAWPLLRPVHADDDGESPRGRAGRVPHAVGAGVRSSRRRRSVRSLRPPAARFPIGTSRGRARSAASRRRAATSATTAATSSIPPISSSRARRSTASRRSSARRRTSSSTCPPSPSGSRPGSRHRATGGRTFGASRSSSSGSSAVDRSRVTSTGAYASPCRATRSATTSGSTSGSTPWSATSRHRSSGPPTVALRMPGASGGRGPRRATTTSWARTTSSSTA